MIPSWVKAGLVLNYFTDEDGYVGIRDTTTVESVSRGVVSAETLTLAVGTDKTYTWTCTDQGSCPDGAAAFQFWIDPNDPLSSVEGQGLPFEYLGTHLLRDPENDQTYTVGVLHYSNATGTVRNTTCFQVGTGLVVEADAIIDRVATLVWYESTSTG